MIKFQFLLLFVFLAFLSFSQIAIPPEIKKIQEELKSGEEITEDEEEKLDRWYETLEEQLDKTLDNSNATKKNPEIKGGSTDALCPKKVTLSVYTELTKEKYVALAKALMETYGAKSGEAKKIKSLLETCAKETDGADIGTLFMMEGAGSASVYSIAWSASRKPDDILTANNLGVTLKVVGEFGKAIQVLKYADKLKPNIALIQCNLGWAYREAGDYVKAKMYFNKALALAPKMTSPNLGLGLIAKCEGNNLKAEEYLRKALSQKYSAIGFAAMKQAQTANQQSGQNNQSEPLTEKGDAGDLNVPELPVFENKTRMAQQAESIENYATGLDSRIQQLVSELQSTLSIIRKQQERALKNPDNSLVFRRDFATEIMQITDVTDLLFGLNGNYGKALNQGITLLEASSKNIQKDIPALTQFQEQSMRLIEQEIKFLELLAACGDNEACIKKIEAQLDQVKYEEEQVAHQVCVLTKGHLDVSFSNEYKCYRLVADALAEAIPDYCAFTNPILEKIYAPSLNEFYNLYREVLILNHLKIASGFAVSLSDFSKEFNELECVEPEPPQPPVDAKEPELPKKENEECPLGKDGIKGGIGVLSFELSCEHVKVSGGEGILWSVKRDFTKHETTIWGGVGVKGEYGNGNITGEATIGAEITIGQGDVVKDVAFTSSVKAGIGGLVEGEVSGRFAMEGGPSIDSNASFIKPDLPSIGGMD